jgi:preprotein translocase subunit YajC
MMFGGFVGFLQQAAPGQRPPQGSMLAALIPFLLVFVVFYLLIIMPTRRKQKKHQTMVEQLKPGDRIITTGGIFGTIMGVQKDKIEVKISANVKVDITKNAVGVILGQSDTPEVR